MTQNINKQIDNRNYDILDLAKFVLCFFVVAIHTSLYPEYLYPWLRIAVPLFFIISSFLFFQRLAKISEEEEKVKMLIHFVKRNLVLYLSWFIILLPFTIYFRKWWFDDGIWTGILRFLRALFFSSTFRASWYITALIISVVIIFVLSRKINNWILLFFSVILYCLCCLSTNYRNAIIGTSLDTTVLFLRKIFGSICETFFSAMFWIVIGKMFAETRIKLKYKTLWPFIVISGILLYLEFIFVQRFSPTANDNYFSLMLFCPILFATLLLFDNVSISHSKKLRKYSTIIYVTHCNVAFLASGFMSRILHIHSSLLVFLVTALVCYGISIIIVYLSKKERFRFLNKLM